MTGEAGPARGIFVSEDELPPAVWRCFVRIAQAHGITPQHLLRAIIIKEVRNFSKRNKPLLDRIVEAGMKEAKKLLAQS